MRKTVTINTIANLAGVHKSTVSKCLANSKEVSKATTARVKEIAERLNYRPSSMARGLAGKETKTIGIIAPELGDQYCIEILNEQINSLQRYGYSCVLIVTNYDSKIERNCVDQIIEKGSDGILVNYILSEETAAKRLVSLRSQGFPIITFGKLSPEVSSIELDFNEAYFAISKHLLNEGHRRICYLFPGTKDERVSGALTAHKEAGLKFNDDFVLDVGSTHDTNYVASVLKKSIMELKATAIVCYCDDLALNVLGEIAKMGLTVPSDISVTSVNDVFFAQNALVPLTTYAWPIGEIGAYSACKLLEMAEKPKSKPFHKIFKGNLIIRKSTSKVVDNKIIVQQDIKNLYPKIDL